MSDLCDENPRLIRSGYSLTLEGQNHRLILWGAMWTKEGWEGSEYTEHTVRYHWIKGEGRVEKKKTRMKKHFLFTTWHGGLDRSFQDFILATDKRQLGFSARPVSEELIKGKEPLLIDQICQRAVGECTKSNGIPKIYFGLLDYDELVAQGFLFDRDNQAHLALQVA